MTEIRLTTREDPSDHNTSRCFILGKTGGKHSHESAGGQGSQTMVPLVFPEAGFADAKFIGFMGQVMKCNWNLNLILSAIDLSEDIAGTSTVEIEDPGGDDFPNYTIKTTKEQLQWLFEYVWVPGSARQSWLYIEDTGIFEKENNRGHLITGITQANPGVVSALAHGFDNGDIVLITQVKGMTEVNKKWFIVANKVANTFELTDRDGNNVNTTGYGAWAGDGYVGHSPLGMKCVITDMTFALSPDFPIDKKIKVTINMNIGENLM